MRNSTTARPEHAEPGVGEAARWMLMLPLAAFCAAIAYGVGAIGLTTLGYALVGSLGDAGPNVAAAASGLASAALAYVFVWTAVVVAPRRRVRVAQALIGVGAAVAAIAMYDAAIAADTVGQLDRGSLASGAGCLAGLLAAGISLRRLRD